jgi:hypothetical protein
VNLAVWKHWTQENQICDVVKFAANPFPLPVLCNLLFPIFGLKMSSL